jgi:hyperosmotically inducible periplasmic protein
MMRRKFVFLSLIIVVALFVGCKASDDAKITTAVKTKIVDDDRLDAAKIDVDTKDGVVTLKGKVLGHEEENRAIEIARSVPNVRNVISKLDVETKLGNAEINERVDENEEAVKKRQEAQEQETIPEAVDDASITAKVKLALAKDETVSALKIDVDTKNRIVTLTGTVKNATEAKRAISVAESVNGVKKVNSVLTISS